MCPFKESSWIQVQSVPRPGWAVTGVFKVVVSATPLLLFTSRDTIN